MNISSQKDVLRLRLQYFYMARSDEQILNYLNDKELRQDLQSFMESYGEAKGE